MKTRLQFFRILLVMAAVVSLQAAAQTTVDQRLVLTRNDGINGGYFVVSLQVKATNLTGANTIGTATIDIVFDPTKLAYSGSAFPDAPSGISSANGYYKSAAMGQQNNLVRIGVIPIAVNGTTTHGADLTTAYVTWATATFTILNSTTTSSVTINAQTNQIGLFESEGNGNGSSRINDQTLSTPIVLTDTPLPVELVSFTVTPGRFGARLEWKTATETNNAGFDIERADAAAAPSSRKWVSMGFVTGAGTSSVEKCYSFTVGNRESGQAIYRLKQIDRNGDFRYSDEVEAATPVVPTQFALGQNYPNPFNPSTQIDIALPEDSRVSIVVYDIIGREAAVILDETRNAGVSTVTFDAGRLASGVYLYRMTARGSRTVFTETKRLVLMR